jgi:hypothetical protein
MATTEAPYDPNGNLEHYPTHRTVWRPNEPFKATLQIETSISGRSAKYLIWVDADGRRWPMFVTDCIDLMRRADVLKGVAEGTWVVRKRGANYGLRLATAKDLPAGG